MLTKEQLALSSMFENEILEVIDNKDEYTRSDVQARIGAIVRRIMGAIPD